MLSKIDNKFNFTEHSSKLCKKASQILHVLARISNYISTNNAKSFHESFLLSHRSLDIAFLFGCFQN